MKLMQAICVNLLALTLSAHAHVLLNAGDVFTYEFTSLPPPLPSPGFVEAPTGGFSIALSSFEAGSDVLFVEMFENSTNEPPLETFVAEYLADGTALEGAWEDLQGTVRFTMLSGSATLEQIVFLHFAPLDTETRDVRQLTVVPVRGAALIEQLVPCAGPRSGGQWKNQGEYRSAIGNAVQELLAAGGLSEQEAHDILQAAARSDCGKK